MSAVPATRTATEPSIPIRVRSRATPAARPVPDVRSRRQSQSLSTLMLRASLLASLSGLTFFCSSIIGSAMLEDARREGLEASAGALEAKRAEAAIRRQVDRLTSSGATESWAAVHGFSAPDVRVQPSLRRTTLVASNH